MRVNCEVQWVRQTRVCQLSWGRRLGRLELRGWWWIVIAARAVKAETVQIQTHTHTQMQYQLNNVFKQNRRPYLRPAGSYNHWLDTLQVLLTYFLFNGAVTAGARARARHFVETGVRSNVYGFSLFVSFHSLPDQTWDQKLFFEHLLVRYLSY